jgi:DNA-binding PadR family transcriptional regulator
VLKYLLLALLSRGAKHGYELKNLFDELLGTAWPMNIAQIYNALTKLEEEGMVESEIVPQENVPNRKVYSLTAEGRRELESWMIEPAEGPVRLRDELYFKVLVGMQVPGARPLDVLARQRQTLVRALADLERAQDDGAVGFETALLLDGAALRLEADLRWLDHCEERLSSRKPIKGNKR